MSKKPKKPPYSWFRWQMRPRIYEEEQFAAKRKSKGNSEEDENSEEGTEESEGEDKKEQIELEKGDLFAMIMSAMLTIFPICVGLLLLIVLLAYFLFFH